MTKTKIIIDPGHGGQDPGAVYRGYQEKHWALDISQKITDALKQQDYLVSLTRKEDLTLSPLQRAKLVRESGAALCISNHINAGGGEGAEVIYSLKDNGLLAASILEELVKAGMRKRRIYTRESNTYPGQDYYFIQRNTRPVETVIVEYGFIDNEGDRDRLAKPEQRQKLALAVAKAIHNYLTSKLVEEATYKLGEGDTTWPQSGEVVIVDTTGIPRIMPAEKALLIDGRWYLEGRALTQILGGRATWQAKTRQAIFDFSRWKTN